MNPVVEDFKDAVKRLEEALGIEKTDVVRDSAIKRFELCFDLAWKAIKTLAREQGTECHSPRACIRSAFEIGLIEYDDRWLGALEDRNMTAHVYAQELAESVYRNLSSHMELFRGLLEKMQSRG